MYKKLLVFASGTKDGGGSGFEKLCQNMENGTLRADIVGVVSNHEHGGIRTKADAHHIPFIYFPQPRDAEQYRKIVADVGAEFVELSGWLKLTKGLDPRTAFNIHPGPLPRFGGTGMYGHYVHEAAIAAYNRGEITHSAVSMHFVTDGYDRGPVFFSAKVAIRPADTAKSLAKRVNAVEHTWQSKITEKILRGEIHWDGKDPSSLVGAIHI